MLFRRGDPQRERFERMAEAVFPSLFGMALRLTKDREEAGDLSQEALVRAYEAFDRFDGRNFKAWILRILTNLYINKYRRRQREGISGSLDEDQAIEPPAPADEAPDRQVFDHLLGAEVEHALAQVPEVFRIAVMLSDIEGMTYEEIAEVTEVPVGTVRSRIARGRAALRQQLEQYALNQGYIKK
ncbi:MAG: sigma-70 family RNA polymerase sigma factor [Fimbriimonadaceae bacterium]|nr:sigma-70 family RNA polymerase sigma factor [Fimbriimonadaceae bacterium]QYK57562.1 MAG: sigma-70 family RNA polymerase sigma factor [Fimbriimonadaceae bacterium]